MHATAFAPWRAASKSIENFIAHPKDDTWRTSKLTELSLVIIAGALIAGVASSSLSWPNVVDAPWTTVSLFYSTLILTLASISAATQQSIALYRLGQSEESLMAIRNLVTTSDPKKPSRWRGYVWQMPVMLLNIGVGLFCIGLIILIWDRAAQTPAWDHDMKIAFVTTLAALFALINYVIGAVALYNPAVVKQNSNVPVMAPADQSPAEDNKDEGK